MTGRPLFFGDLRLDRSARRIYRGKTKIHVGPTEFKLMECLMERPGRVLSREQLLTMVWQHDSDVELRTVDVHIGRLRKALSVDSDTVEPAVTTKICPIRTVRAAGYALDESYAEV